MLMMYGYAPDTTNDQVIQAADESTTLANTLLDFGGTFINMLPFLYYIPAWVPGAKGRQMIEKVKRLNDITRCVPLAHVTAALVRPSCSFS